MKLHNLVWMGDTVTCVVCGATGDKTQFDEKGECSGVKPADDPLVVQEPLKPRNTGLKMDDPDTGVTGPAVWDREKVRNLMLSLKAETNVETVIKYMGDRVFSQVKPEAYAGIVEKVIKDYPHLDPAYEAPYAAPPVLAPSPPLPPAVSTDEIHRRAMADVSVHMAATILMEWREKFPDLHKHWLAVSQAPTHTPTANTILQDAQQHLLDRAAQRDQASERSMERAVRAYNAITGHELSERDGWMFMVVLKATRACTTPAGIPDDYEDLVAYGALAGESAGKA